MLVKKVNVVGFRNLKNISIDTSASVNCFYGKNGSGKTSLLEALYFLSRARSFRSNKRNHLINVDESYLAVAALLEQNGEHRLGLDLDEKGNSRLKLDGEILNRLSEGTSLFPVQLITPESFDVFFSSPKARRGFLDFGLFHVEHEYQKCWSDYQKQQKQINALLKTGNADQRELVFWYKGLVNSAAKVEDYRNQFIVSLLQPMLNELTSSLQNQETVELLKAIEIKYKSKIFDATDDLDNAIRTQIFKDQKYRQVGFGPSKADILFTQNGEDITNMLSRGQSKMLFYLLEVGMVRLVKNISNKNMLLLIDDLPSEVDEFTRETMLEMLLNSEAQVFVTGIESKIAMEFKKYTNSVNVFHVEHGAIKPENMEQLCP
ncbi:DNA replication/repair protein RecF [Psychrosphaera aestuarii]|uniref:DNA replication/repair protein RecF n=1 Tax=Psychrosphaera aestuarii TaxID=1266052 RepID=UPI001B33DA19|nr:DNA replication and repair protein RecF [Psychrosphaera aestuarii]